MTPSGGQLFLDFPRIDPVERPLIETGSYAAAVGAIRRWRHWPGGQLALVGEACAGKTRLVRFWASDAGAALVTGEALAHAEMDEIAKLSVLALAIDDADHPAAALGLLAALNLCRDRGAPVLVSGRIDPAGWHSRPLDLKSRLAAMPVAHIELPDDETLAFRLREECALRHLILPDESVVYLARRVERSWAAVGQVADQIERTPGRAESLRSARAVLTGLGMDPG
ncbi:MAG: DNA replication ATPase [Hyphomonadaceae bacterium]|nr:DNA replication ATPase [Hyphomonadaceae bacterium]MBP9234521.1 DNA replication ATPase [Hyphomonadaceae bacterium]